jgi:hypothetical protein
VATAVTAAGEAADMEAVVAAEGLAEAAAGAAEGLAAAAAGVAAVAGIPRTCGACARRCRRFWKHPIA